MKYFISDQHWGHGAIIHMEHRPFSNVQEMNESMIEAWNSVVTKDDEVYHLGDVAYKMNPTQLNSILSRLNGKIYLIHGNHDKPKQLKHSWDRFEWVKSEFNFEYEYEGAVYKFVLYHFPIYSWDQMWRGSIHVCGHSHMNSNDFFDNCPARIINVSCELLDYKPISIVEVIEKMRNKQVIPPTRKEFRK